MVYQEYFQAIKDYRLFGDTAIDGAFENSIVWTQSAIDNLPLVLCGPILRRCEPKSVTVWGALKSGDHLLQLSVYADNNGLKSGEPLLTGTALERHSGFPPVAQSGTPHAAGK